MTSKLPLLLLSQKTVGILCRERVLLIALVFFVPHLKTYAADQAQLKDDFGRAFKKLTRLAGWLQLT